MPPTTDRYRKVIQLAEQEARQSECGYLGTEHLFLALTSFGSVTSFILDRMGIDMQDLNKRFREELKRPCYKDGNTVLDEDSGVSGQTK